MASHGGVGQALRGAAAVAGCTVLLRPVGARLLLRCRAALAAGLQVVVVFILQAARGEVVLGRGRRLCHQAEGGWHPVGTGPAPANIEPCGHGALLAARAVLVLWDLKRGAVGWVLVDNPPWVGRAAPALRGSAFLWCPRRTTRE